MKLASCIQWAQTWYAGLYSLYFVDNPMLIVIDNRGSGRVGLLIDSTFSVLGL